MAGARAGAGRRRLQIASTRVAWASAAGVATPQSRGLRRAPPHRSHPALVPPDPRREAPEQQPASACLPPPSSPPRPRRKTKRTRRRGAAGSRRRRRRGVQLGPRGFHYPQRAGSPFRGVLGGRRYPMLTDLSPPRNKMGPGSSRRRLHGRRHFVRRRGARPRVCVYVRVRARVCVCV